MGHQPSAKQKIPIGRQQSSGTVVVLGGGLAGMAAAWRLLNLGYQVTLIERRRYLGGRAYSFQDKETNQQVDNGQHVFLGCCTAYTRFLDEIGTLHLTHRQRSLRIEVRDPQGKRGILSTWPLPVPFHLGYSLLRYPHIGWADKFRMIWAMLNIKMEKNRNRQELQQISFYDWLRQKRQSQRAIDNLWELIILPALNDGSRQVSASMAFMVFQEALLRNRHGGNVGYATGGLSEIMGDAIERQLRKRGVRLMLGRSVKRLLINSNKSATGVELAGGQVIRADWYVSSVLPATFLEFLPEPIRLDPNLLPASQHTWAPVVNLHIWYDREVADFEFATFINSPVQWVFNKSRISSPSMIKGSVQYLTISLSGAWNFWPMNKIALKALFVLELERILPKARGAKVKRFLVVKERNATFRSLPGKPTGRLSSKTPIRNLLLAGDWTDTGWPATMESAVRSGFKAADQIDAQEVL